MNDTGESLTCDETEAVPWDDAHGHVLRSLRDTTWQCLAHPFDFFSRAGKSEDRWSALGFAMVLDVFGWGCFALWTTVFRPEVTGPAAGMLILAPIRVLASVWIGSEMMHFFLKLLRAKPKSRAVTHRVVAFCYSAAVLGIVPVWGIRLGLGAALVYQVFALRQAHDTRTWQAVVAVVSTWLVLFGLLLLAALSGAPVEQ